MDQREIRCSDHLIRRAHTAAEGGAGEQVAAIHRGSLHPLDEFVHAPGLQHGMVVTGAVRLVVDFDQYVPISVGEHPPGGFIHPSQYGGFVLQTLVLAKVKVTEDHDHPEPVCRIQNALQSLQIRRAEASRPGQTHYSPTAGTSSNPRETLLAD
jgi:hypothetical protein